MAMTLKRVINLSWLYTVLASSLFCLMNSSGGGKTIIEALEGKIGRDYSSDFGIVQ